MRALSRVAVLGGLLLGGVLVVVLNAGVAEARPPSPFLLDTFLKGEPRRWLMPDAGWSSTVGSAVSCLPVTSTYCPTGVLKLTPPAKVHVCVGQTSGTWDGGCVIAAGDPNYGDPAAADAPYFLTVKSDTATVCTMPATGSVTTPIFCMQ